MSQSYSPSYYASSDSRTESPFHLQFRDHGPISGRKLGLAIICFTRASTMALLESLGGATGSSIRKNLAISAFASSKREEFYILTDGICSTEFQDAGCASLAKFAESAALNDKAIWALFLSLSSISWIHIVSAVWALVSTLVLIISYYHHKRIYYRQSRYKARNTKDKKRWIKENKVRYDPTAGKARALHPLTKLSFCAVSCVLSFSVLLLAITQNLWSSKAVEKLEETYTPKPPAGLLLAIFAFVLELLGCFFISRQSVEEIEDLIDEAEAENSRRKQGFPEKLRNAAGALVHG